MAAVEIRDVWKSFGTTDVIRGVSIDSAEGEFCVFVGPSGCGKSTLLRLIAGLEELTGGDIEIGGRNVNKAGPIERGVAMVFQNYALYPHMTVEQNIDSPCAWRGWHGSKSSNASPRPRARCKSASC